MVNQGMIVGEVGSSAPLVALHSTTSNFSTKATSCLKRLHNTRD
jgi:hypothetical protein